MPQLSWWHNHVLPAAAAAGCTQSATSTTLQPRRIVRSPPGRQLVGGRKKRGERLERLSGGSGGSPVGSSSGGPAPRAAQTTPRFSRRHESAGQAPSRSLRST